MSPDERRHDYSDVIDRLARVEAVQQDTKEDLRTHMHAEEAKIDRIFTAVERVEQRIMGAVKEMANEVADIKRAREKEKGFVAGAVFVVTALAGVLATVWHKFVGTP